MVQRLRDFNGNNKRGGPIKAPMLKEKFQKKYEAAQLIYT